MIEISGGISGEAGFLAASAIAGMFLFFVYDCLRIYRRLIRHNTFWVGVEDTFYWIFCSVAVFLLVYRQNDGRMRGFVWLGLFIGMLTYYLIFSRYVIFVHVFVGKKIKKLLQDLFCFLFRPVRKTGGKMFGIAKKKLKKTWKTVRIVLYKR